MDINTASTEPRLRQTTTIAKKFIIAILLVSAIITAIITCLQLFRNYRLGFVKFTIDKEVLQDNIYIFTVTDSGPGISAEAQELIFNPFHQDVQGLEKS